MDEPHIHLQERAPPITPTRKRQIDSDSDEKGAPLTRDNLARLDKMVKKKAVAFTDESGSIKTSMTSTTIPGFNVKAIKNGIVPAPSSKAPANLMARRKRGAESLGTASPTESEHRGFVKRIKNAGNEATILWTTNKLLKEYNDEDYVTATDRAFTGFPKYVGFNNDLSAPQPDFVEGSRMQDYLPFPVDEHVNGAVLYKDDPCSVTLPHIAGEWKGPTGNLKEAELQTGYD